MNSRRSDRACIGEHRRGGGATVAPPPRKARNFKVTEHMVCSTITAQSNRIDMQLRRVTGIKGAGNPSGYRGVTVDIPR